LTELTADEIVLACEQNYIDYWRCAGAQPYGEFSDEGGITYCVTGLPQEIFNVVLKCNLNPKLMEARIDEAIAHFRSKRIPLIWHVGLSTEPREVAACLEARGFPKDYDLTAMAFDLENLDDERTAWEGIEVRRVATVEECRQWIECLATSWESPREVSNWMLGNPCFNLGVAPATSSSIPRTMYLGVLDGKPAGAAMLFWSEQIAGLQAIGTVKTAQQRGVGSAAIRAALRDAHGMGFKFVAVLSTVEGRRLYLKNGFEIFGKLPEHSMYFGDTRPH